LAIKIIDGHMLRKAIIAGANELDKCKDYVDSLNVFPVPDGDTGINMSLTTIAAAKEVEKLNTKSIAEVAKAASNGSLRGARGNSGVILSQLFRGFAKGLSGKESATAADIAEAFMQGALTAYKAVMKPKEGTILTVAKAFAKFCAEAAEDTDDIEILLKEGLEFAEGCLAQTTEMLAELKAANVVDAGAYGLLKIIEGGFSSRNTQGVIVLNDPAASKPLKELSTTEMQNVHIEYAYCTEFIIEVSKVIKDTEESLKKYLSTMGDSIVVVADEDIVKVHLHTNNPGQVMEKALTIGYLDNIKIENMRSQHTNSIHFNSSPSVREMQPEEKPVTEHKEDAFICVASGSGLSKMFSDLGADAVVHGGQSMNPSTEDILEAIKAVSADNIFVLPNNKNIILAAEQAAKLSGKNVYVLPTKTIPQGISAFIGFMPGASPDENVENMSEAATMVKTGMVTYAVRASSVEDIEITDGDILGMIEDRIEIVEKDVNLATRMVIDKLFEQGGDILSIYYGEQITEDEAMAMVNYASEKYPDCESACLNGGQPIYHYILSVE